MLFLVVDDDGLSRELLTLLLEAEGYAVEADVSGEAAVARVASAPGPMPDVMPMPDVIMTDIQMPGLAGGALAAALRGALRNGRGTPLLLAMSGSQPEAATLEGFDGFLLKPFQVSELRSMLMGLSSPASEPCTPPAESASGVPASAEGPTVCGEAPDPDAADSGALDEEIFGKMRELMPVEQLGEMYVLCTQDARRRIARMRELAEAGDEAQYRAEAHTVKGGSGMIGARELHGLAAAAECDGLDTGQKIYGTSTVKAALTQMSLACDRLERILGERTRESIASEARAGNQMTETR